MIWNLPGLDEKLLGCILLFIKPWRGNPLLLWEKLVLFAIAAMELLQWKTNLQQETI